MIGRSSPSPCHAPEPPWTQGPGWRTLANMSGVPTSTPGHLAPRAEWFTDARPGDRGLRVSWHLDMGCVVLSTWRDGGCVSTSRLTPDEAARLISVLADGLAAAADIATINSATTDRKSVV